MDTQPHVTPLIDDDNDLHGVIYTERDTSLLYEVKFFDSFVIVRPASPAFYLAIRKMSHNEFADEFDEYNGNHDEVFAILRGPQSDLIIE